MRSRPPWQYVAAGAVSVVLLLGYTGNLTSVTFVDRLTNPDARNYWESESDHLREIFDFCSDQSATLAAETGESGGRASRVFMRCLDASIEEALERGYVTKEGVSHFDP